MNYKKGLIRIFVIGLVIAPIAGFFSSAEDSNKIAMNGHDTISTFNRQSKVEPCASTIKSNPKVSPKFPGLDCFVVEIYWSKVREWQNENGKAGQLIDDETFKKAIDADTSKRQWETRWFHIALFTFGYLFIWLACLIVFFVIRWIIRGFKSK